MAVVRGAPSVSGRSGEPPNPSTGSVLKRRTGWMWQGSVLERRTGWMWQDSVLERRTDWMWQGSVLKR